MARTITVEVFQYSELSDAAKAKARDWWREAPHPHETWSESVTEDLKTIAGFMGWTVTRTAFSGFGSQGDGAQFAGTWSARSVIDNAGKLEQHAPAAASPNNMQLRNILVDIARVAAKAPDASASVWSVGNYSHSHATRFDTPDLRNEQLDRLMEATRALMDWYYRRLEDAYCHETSDESVAELIEANEYEFTADGKRFIAK